MEQSGISKRLGFAIGFAVSIVFLLVAIACAAPGQRDRGFGERGIAATELEPNYPQTAFTAVTELADGGILASRDGIAQRYSAFGVRDTSFPAEPFHSSLSVTQADGKLLVRGEHGGIKRLLPDGSPDPGFHGGESEELPRLTVQAIAVSDSGEIFVAGVNTYVIAPKGCNCQMAVAHINPDGTLDEDFGTAGLAGLLTDFKIEGLALRGLAAQGDGGVVVVAANVVLKLTASGKVDTAWGKDGKLDPGLVTVADFQALPGDGLELVGAIGGPSAGDRGADFFAARYGSTGQPDPDFADGDGVATIDFGGADVVHAATFGADGSILLGGSTTASKPCVGSCESAPAIARLTPAGHPDGSFGDRGRVRIEALRGGGGHGVLALLSRDDGGIVAGGSAGEAGSIAFMAALGSGGSPQPAFGEGGLVTERQPRPSEQIGDPVVEIGPDRRIYVGSWTSAGPGNGGLAVIRYRRGGELDRSFGEGRGYVSSTAGENAAALAIDKAGGSIVLSEPNRIYRFTPDGHIDPGFAAGQRVILRDAPAHFRDIAVQPDGRVLVAGTTSWLGNRGRMLIARLLRNGRLDPSFGHDGYVSVGCRRRGRCKAVRVMVRRDGRILIAGAASKQGGFGREGEGRSRIALAQLLPSGRNRCDQFCETSDEPRPRIHPTPKFDPRPHIHPTPRASNRGL